MFKPVAMRHVVLHLVTDDLPQASLTLADTGLFCPDPADRFSNDFPQITGEEYREVYHQASVRFQKIQNHVQLYRRFQLPRLHVPSLEQLQQTNQWLGEIWEKCSAYEESLRGLSDAERTVDQLSLALDNFANLHIDLSRLHGNRQFLDIHVGMLPRTNVSQLRGAVELAGYQLFSYMQSSGNTHCIILGPKGEREEELHSVLDTAGFTTFHIPPELHDKPDTVRASLLKRREKLAEERAIQDQAMADLGEEWREQLEQARKVLVLAEPFVRIEGAARSLGHLSILTGWMPAGSINRAKEDLKRTLAHPYILNSRKPLPQEYLRVPSYLPENRLMSPFSSLVKQYGTPRYGEVDPTPVFAISFIVMFGMMFGDIGHGLVIALAGWLAGKWLRRFRLFAVWIGLSSALFGLSYGSIFGYEHLFHALWIAPMSDPVYMLSVALAWGVFFVLTTSLLCIHNRLAAGEVGNAGFEANGAVSITLYLSVVSGSYNLFTTGHYGRLEAVLSVLAILILLAYKVYEVDGPASERFLVALIETFETITGYISNTLSFLRVAAFSLNHVALSIAVFTLAGMMDTMGHWLMVIGGNLFILILEGAIVTIQVLRLEYYEGFSRFFSGDGVEFKPLSLPSGALR